MATQNATNLDSRLTAGEVRYSTGAIILHWLLALAMGFQLAIGFAMPHRGPHSFAPMQLHKSIGVTILLLTLIRLGWRLVRRPPAAVEEGWTAVAARLVHWAFYAVLLLGPITGWIIVSTASLHVPTVLFGVLPWPHLPLPQALNRPMEETHEALSWLAIGLFVLHVGGALRHQFLLRDPVIKRIAPAGSVAAAMALLVATIAIYFLVGSYVSQKYLAPRDGGISRDSGARRSSSSARRHPCRGCPARARTDQSRHDRGSAATTGVDNHGQQAAGFLGRQRWRPRRRPL